MVYDGWKTMSTPTSIPFDANEFDGKRVLVTGGTKGSEYVIDGGTIPTI